MLKTIFLLTIFSNIFSELGVDILQSKNIESESFVSGYDFFYDLEQGEAILDEPFTVDEIIGAVKLLKRGKSPGKDFLLNEYFIESIDILASHICDIFNCILDTGCSRIHGRRVLLYLYIKRVTLITLTIIEA